MFFRIVLIVVVLAVALALGFPAAPHIGWASPFAYPTHVGYRRTSYYPDPAGKAACTAEKGAHRVGSVFGYFTSSKPIFLTNHEWKHGGKVTWILLDVRPGCFKLYANTADMG